MVQKLIEKSQDFYTWLVPNLIRILAALCSLLLAGTVWFLSELVAGQKEARVSAAAQTAEMHEVHQQLLDEARSQNLLIQVSIMRLNAIEEEVRRIKKHSGISLKDSDRTAN